MVDEFLALAYYHERGLPIVVFRLFNTVGPRQTGRYGMVIPRFVGQALRNEPLSVYGDGGQSRCFLHVQDAVEAILALAENPGATGQVFNVGSIEEISILDLARLVLELVNAPGRVASQPSPQESASPSPENEPIIFIPYEQAYAEGFDDMRRRVPDTSRIEALTGWKPRHTLRQTLEEIIEYMRPNV
jgi:UDP-glucose 4-epimerase